MKIYLSVFILIPCLFFGLDLKGIVIRADTKASLQSAAVLLYSGTNLLEVQQTEEDGVFHFQGLDKAKYRLEVKASGYYTEKTDIDLKGNINKNVYLITQNIYSLGEVTVIGEKEKGTQSKTTVTKSEREKAIASVTGDPVSSITSMPGVETIGGAIGSPSKLSVRGGSGYENSALLDDALIPYPYHRLFPDSVFINSLVGDITLYKGVLPARYGQVMSSLLDVKMDDASPGYFHGRVELGLLNISAMLDGSSPDGKWSWIGGIRRIDYDWVLPLFVQFNNGDAGRQIELPYYLDSQGKIQYKDAGDLVSLIWHYSSEPTKFYFVLSNTNRINTPDSLSAEENFYDVLLNLRWKHIFSNSFSLDQIVRGLVSEDYINFKLTNIAGNNTSYYTKTAENNLQYKIMANVSPIQIDTVRFGGEVLFYPDLEYSNLAYRTVTNSSTGLQETQTLLSSDYHGTYGIYAGFLENESLFLDSRLTVLAGLRYSYVDFVKKTALDPRLTVEYQIIPVDKIYTALGYLSQFPSDSSQLSEMETNRETLDIPGVYHVVLGNLWQITPALSLSVEGYYKDYNNQLSEKSSLPVTFTTSGSDTHIYGAEVLLKKKSDGFPLYGWAGFSSYQIWNFNSISPPQTGGMSTAYPPTGQWYQGDSLDYKFDMTVIWDLDRNWSLTGEFSWRSGSHYTAITGSKQMKVFTNTVNVPVFGDYNSAKFEDIHSLNLKVERKAEIFSLPGGFYFQLVNVYNYKPIQGYSYNSDYSQATPQRSFIGIYPVFGAWLEW